MKERVAIVVPNYKEVLSPAEAFSLHRLTELYGNRPLFALLPEHAPEAAKAIPTRFQPLVFPFRTLLDYSSLLVNPCFYERFRDFAFILIHQLDVYLFSDRLDHWCSLGFDYVGAPIFEGFQPPDPHGKMRWVGNGGFSLRRVDAALRVLRSKRRYRTFSASVREARASGLPRLAAWRKCLHRLTLVDNGVQAAVRDSHHEDMFWATGAEHFYPPFRRPEAAQALDFAFEYAPRYCFEMNGGRLPFGCHAWQKYDPEFWREHIPFREEPA